MNKYRNIGVRILWTVFFCVFSLFPIEGLTPENTEDAILFQISTPKNTYRPGEKAVINFTMVNRGATPIYIARRFVCSKWTGFVDLRIQNSQGQNVENGGCDAFILPIPMDKIRQEVTDSRGWLRLDPYEMYGEEGEFELARKKGTYRLVADLLPPGFTKQQKEFLASEQIHVLQAHHVAPAVTITVK